MDFDERWVRLVVGWGVLAQHTLASSLRLSMLWADESSSSLLGSWSAAGRSGSVCETVEALLSEATGAGIPLFVADVIPNNSIIYSMILLTTRVILRAQK